MIVVDDHQRTNVEGIWALGDIANHFQLKHVSNHEARVIQHNLLHLDDPAAMVTSRHDAVPSAVFSSPQVSSVGLTERDARGPGHPLRDRARRTTATRRTAGRWRTPPASRSCWPTRAPGGSSARTSSGAQASNLIQPLIQAMAFGQTAHEVARGQYWIHPALMEVTENLLLALPR